LPCVNSRNLGDARVNPSSVPDLMTAVHCSEPQESRGSVADGKISLTTRPGLCGQGDAAWAMRPSQCGHHNADRMLEAARSSKPGRARALEAAKSSQPRRPGSPDAARSSQPGQPGSHRNLNRCEASEGPQLHIVR